MAHQIFSPRRFCIAYMLLSVAAASALAQGRIIIEPPLRPRPRPLPVTGVPLRLKQLAVNTEITDGVAVTTVKQTFRNQSGRQIEGTYVFPLPDDAAVGSFSMAINGNKLHGEVLDADEARRTYQQIVRRMRDPGLLEYLGSRLYRASIFPIPPGGLAEVELQYTQTLRESSGMGLFQHPLRGSCSGDVPVEQVVFHVKLRSQTPMTSVFCPTHKCEIVRPSDYEATVGFEQSDVRLDSDFQLYYQRSNKMLGISLLAHRGAGEAGYFLLRIAPRIEISTDQIQAKDIAFVIDTSGSMRGGKIEQAREALKFCVDSLHTKDRFNIYGFSTEVHPFRDGLVPADADIKAAAAEFANDMQALGGTNINQALLAALEADPGDDERPYLIVFMTDGKPTVDVTDPDRILKQIGEHNGQRVRFHVLGVGTDVNTHLLDKLAELNRGTREYCIENEDLELKLSAMVSRLSSPVLTDITLSVAGLKTFDIYPQTLPDLFRGGDLIVLGRYDGSGDYAVKLTGRMLDDLHTIVHEAEFPGRSRENDFLPRLWAQRKVAYLLDQIRLHGRDKELEDEVVRLAKRFGIVTPYTSALIVEDEKQTIARGGGVAPALAGPRVIGEAARRAGGVGGAIGGGPVPKSTSGRGAVRASRDLERLRSLGYVGDSNADAVEVAGKRVIRNVGEKTFVFDGERWIDTTWEGKPEPKKITAFGDEYFKLIEQHKELARFFALGEHVLVVFDGAVYETVPASDSDEDK